MIIGTTGARVFREDGVYKVEYQNTVIYENKIRGVAIVLGLDKNKCMELLTEKTKCV